MGKVTRRHSLPCFLASLRRIALWVPARSCFVIHVFGVLSFPCLTLPSSTGVSWDHQDNYLHWHLPQGLLLCWVGRWDGSDMHPTGHQNRTASFLVASDLPFLAWSTPLEGRLLKLPFSGWLSVVDVINNFKHTGLKQQPASARQFHGLKFNKVA